jgi:ethanolamine utilization protein EutQ (cupin superfamily)
MLACTPAVSGVQVFSEVKNMPKLIEQPTRVTAAGNKPKLIDEFVGRVNSAESRLSLALMQSPAGWQEPGQRPEFDEWTLVLEGEIEVEHEAGTLPVRAGQAVLAQAGEWVRYKTPDGAKYVAICLPAFSPDNVHRDAASR